MKILTYHSRVERVSAMGNCKINTRIASYADERLQKITVSHAGNNYNNK